MLPKNRNVSELGSCSDLEDQNISFPSLCLFETLPHHIFSLSSASFYASELRTFPFASRGLLFCFYSFVKFLSCNIFLVNIGI
jgi:hypothetical protein